MYLSDYSKNIIPAEEKVAELRQQRDKLDAQLATEREKVRVLREACKRLRDCDWVITLPNRMDAVRDIARAAIDAAMKEETK